MAEYTCPHCRQPIDDDEALLCLYCGEGLDRRGGGLGDVRSILRRMVIIVIALAVLVTFVVLVVR